jgi:Bacterial capsule synthesis protein PGA_cap
VLRKVELYKNKLIVYSLGNFIFDYPGAEKNRFAPGIAIKVYLKRNGDFKKAELISYALIKGVPQKDSQQRGYAFMRRLSLDDKNKRLVFQKNGTVIRREIQ